ncbi:hypothetical protein DSCO28_63520 [Desulfosarcina ovata subsp. sediminis]|uniref:Uncharacterized protein n=2 Tax=Desulfosarcina ovata TaxID=83564 RepID=A0A5K8A044_9BACT|nr:hypothetical protein DSCO28_63520 [Desulfosarcina ovata subsp. sediminis]
MNTNTFFDKFFYISLVFVASLTFIDFLLGEEKRNAMKDRLGCWWIYLSDISYAGLVANDAKKVRLFIDKVLGNGFFSFRFFISSMILSVGFLWLTDFIAVNVFLENVSTDYSSWDIESILLMISNGLLNYFSFGITVHLLKKMESQTSIVILVVILLSDIIIASIIALIAYVLMSVILGDAESILEVVAHAIVLVIVMISSFIPTIIHALFTLLFLLSKLFRPLIQKPSELVLLRLSQSSKGILTLLAAAIATIAKLIEEGIQIFGWFID